MPGGSARLRYVLALLALLATPAAAVAQIGSSCLRPIAIPDRWEEHQTGTWDPLDTFDRYNPQGQVIANADVYRPPEDASPTGFTPATDEGRLLEFQLGSAGSAPTASGAFGIRMGDGGGSSFVDNITNCPGTFVGPGFGVQLEPGNLLGPFRTGFQNLIAQDPTAAWDPAANITGGVVGSAFTVSPRLIGVLAYDPDVYARGLQLGTIDLRVVRVVGFFVQSVSADSTHIVVHGYLTGRSTITAEPVSTTFGGSGTLSATVTGPASPLTGVPIAFTVDGTPAGTALTGVNGRAVLSGVPVTGRNAGTYEDVIAASLEADSGFFSAASGAADLTVVKASSTISLTSSPSPSLFGQTVTLTARVSGPGGVPTGSVTFLDGAQQLGSVALDAAATAALAVPNLALGTRQLSAQYGGSANLTAGSTTVSHSVTVASTATTLSSSSNPSRTGDSIVLTASVAAVLPGGGVPTGLVDFFRGTQLMTTVTLSAGVASVSTGPLGNGKIKFSARYRGTTGYAASASPELTQTVQKK